jgi:tetratricopeptide (TPR) repeat protein
VLGLLLGGAATAAEPATRDAQAPETAAAAPETAVEAAERHNQLGLEHYHAKRYPEAVGEMLAAYRAVPDAALLYNIARIYQTIGEKDLAISYFHRFVKSPDAEPATVEKAVARLAELRSPASPVVPVLETARPSVQSTAPLVEAPAAEPVSIWRRGSFAVGAVGVVTAVVTGGLAAAEHGKYLDSELGYDERLAAQARGERLVLWSDLSWVLAVVGGGGAVWAGTSNGVGMRIGVRW